MASVNRVTLVGSLGADPAICRSANGDGVASVFVATTDTWDDKSGNKQETTEWHRVTFFGHLAEIVGQYLQKGSAIYVEGRLKTNHWQDRTGNDRYSTEIIADQMQMLGGQVQSQTRRTTPAQIAKIEAKQPLPADPVGLGVSMPDSDLEFVCCAFNWHSKAY